MIVWVQLRANCALDSDRMARPQEEEKARSLESMKEKKKKKPSGKTLEAQGDNYLSQAAYKFERPLNVRALSPVVIDVAGSVPPGHIMTLLPHDGSRLDESHGPAGSKFQGRTNRCAGEVQVRIQCFPAPEYILYCLLLFSPSLFLLILSFSLGFLCLMFRGCRGILISCQ